MEENMNEIERLLEKIHIDLYEEDGKSRYFLSVMTDLAKSWEVLNDDYKDELYEAMGIVPPTSSLGVIKPQDIKPEDLNYFKETGIEYLRNQPTCRSEVK